MSREADFHSRLLRYMDTELAAARALFMDGLLDQAALHILRSWHTVASLHAREDGGEEPPLEDFEVDLARTPVRPRAQKLGDGFQAGLAAVRALADKDPAAILAEAGGAAAEPPPGELRRRRRQLEVQLRLAEELHRKLVARRRVAALRRRLPSRKAALAVAGGLVVAAIAAGVTYRAATRPGAREEAKGPGPAPAAPAPPPRPPRELQHLKNLTVEHAKVAEPREPGLAWDAKGTLQFKRWIKVKLKEASSAPKLDLLVDNNDTYSVIFENRGEEVGAVMIKPDTSKIGMRSAKVEVPAAAVEASYDIVTLKAIDGDFAFSLGHLLLME